MKIDRPTLCYADTLESINTARGSHVFDVAPNEGVSTSDMLTLVHGRTCFRVRINTVSMDHENRPFSIFVSPEGSGSPSAASELPTLSSSSSTTTSKSRGLSTSRILPASSQPMTVVLHKLSLDSCLDEWQKTWYNQMGGDKNCIKLVVNVLDAKGKVDRKRRNLPLRVVLLHDDDESSMVRSQNILVVSEDSQLSTEKGTAVIKVRVTEVSRRHQNKPFKFRIEPDGTKDPLSMDVQSVVSPGVMVLSKITPKVKPAPKLKTRPSLALPTRIDIMNFEGGPSGSTTTSSPAPSLGVAMQRVFRWVESSIQAHQATRWQEYGHSLNPTTGLTGAPDASRPLYVNVGNPNDIIDPVLQTYSREVASSLQMLRQHLQPHIDEGKNENEMTVNKAERQPFLTRRRSDRLSKEKSSGTSSEESTGNGLGCDEDNLLEIPPPTNPRLETNGSSMWNMQSDLITNLGSFATSSFIDSLNVGEDSSALGGLADIAVASSIDQRAAISSSSSSSSSSKSSASSLPAAAPSHISFPLPGGMALTLSRSNSTGSNGDQTVEL